MRPSIAMLPAFLLFAATSAATVALWNRCFTPVPVRVALLLWAVCALFQARTLFTTRVDLPGNLAYVAYPWMATGKPPVKANTGIIFTQIAPWTRIAGDVLKSGAAPLWNRTSESGAPLLANQQTAIFHPFTLLGLLLPLGKSFTFSASIRLFAVIFFTFVFLRQLGIGGSASVFGAVAFTFCTFHVVWLLFPLGLASMMLPVCLAAVHETAANPRPAAFVFLVVALACSVLGGHPESAAWVWIASAAYALFVPSRKRFRTVAVIAAAFVLATTLTAFFWLPTLRVLQVTARYVAMQSKAANPANHDLSCEWLLPLIAPNIFGNSPDGTYTPPRGSHPAVLNDYGEVASSYAGLATLGLALAAPFLAWRRRGFAFAVTLALFALMTFAEVPIWRDAIRAIPLVGISLHQRLRLFWDLGVCIAAALTLDEVVKGAPVRAAVLSLAVVIAVVALVYAMRHPAFLASSRMAVAQLAIPIAATMAVAILLMRGVRSPIAIAALVFIDLLVATNRYNPPARPSAVYPVTGAIAFLQHQPAPYRMAAYGWSFLPETPGFYGIEDIKTTNPIQHVHYMRLMKEHLSVERDSYDLLIADVTRPFFDYLNVRYLYVPPDQTMNDPRFIVRYRGSDGMVLENPHALPRYFMPHELTIDPNFDSTAARLRGVADFRQSAVVDQLPAAVRRMGFDFGGDRAEVSAGAVGVVSYRPNRTELDVHNDYWGLLVSSDVNWPGWRATINGRELPAVTVNGAFLGCYIPPGGGRLRLEYRPAEYVIGLYAFAATVVIMIAIVITWRRREPIGGSNVPSRPRPLP